MQRSHCLWIGLLLLAAAGWVQTQEAGPARRLSVGEPLELRWSRAPGCYGTIRFRLEVRSDGRNFRYRAELRARKSFVSEETRTEELEGELTGREFAGLLRALDRPETWRESPPGVIGGATWSVEAGPLRVREVDWGVARAVEGQTVVGDLETRLRVRMGLPPDPGPD